MTKSKTAAEKTVSAAETNFKAGTDAFKAGLEKTVAAYDTVLSYSKDTAEAYLKSATIAGKGLETINSELYSFSKAAVEDSVAAGKAVLGSKSVNEAFELQSDFAKAAFESYVEELTKFSALFTATAKDAFAPLQSRYQAWVDIVQNARAA